MEQLTSNALGISVLTASIGTDSIDSSSALAFAAVIEREATLERESLAKNIWLNQQMLNEERKDFTFVLPNITCAYNCKQLNLNLSSLTSNIVLH